MPRAATTAAVVPRPDAVAAEGRARDSSTTPAPPKRFPGELADDFEVLLARARRPAGPVARLLTWLGGRPPAGSDIAFDGFYDRQFDEKRERMRRYGEVYTVEDLGGGYLLRLELPRRVPVTSVKERLGIADEMPDYEYALMLANGSLLVRARVGDAGVRKVASGAPAFPPEFSTRIALGAPVHGFGYRYRDKTLEVVLLKSA